MTVIGNTIVGFLIPSTLFSNETYKYNGIIELSELSNRDVMSHIHISNEAAALRLGN